MHRLTSQCSISRQAPPCPLSVFSSGREEGVWCWHAKRNFSFYSRAEKLHYVGGWDQSQEFYSREPDSCLILQTELLPFYQIYMNEVTAPKSWAAFTRASENAFATKLLLFGLGTFGFPSLDSYSHTFSPLNFWRLRVMDSSAKNMYSWSNSVFPPSLSFAEL